MTKRKLPRVLKAGIDYSYLFAAKSTPTPQDASRDDAVETTEQLDKSAQTVVPSSESSETTDREIFEDAKSRLMELLIHIERETEQQLNAVRGSEIAQLTEIINAVSERSSDDFELDQQVVNLLQLCADKLNHVFHLPDGTPVRLEVEKQGNGKPRTRMYGRDTNGKRQRITSVRGIPKLGLDVNPYLAYENPEAFLGKQLNRNHADLLNGDAA